MNQIKEYMFGPHLQKRINNKEILIQDIMTVLNNKNVLRLRGENNATKLVLNKTRIKKSLEMSGQLEADSLKRIYKEGGLTIVVNERTKFIITAY